MRLLIIEDAARLRETLGRALSRTGHVIDLAEDGMEGEAMARSNDYNAIDLDRMLPEKDGLDVLKDLRDSGIDTPVLLLTALYGVEEKVRGLGLRADDYLTKPFALVGLAARLQALGRRRYGQPDPYLRVGPLVIDTTGKSVRYDGRGVTLTAREFALLEILARRPGQVFSRAQIEAHLYSESDGPFSNAANSAIC